MHKTASYLDRRIIAAVVVSVFALAILGASFTFAKAGGGERRALTEEQRELIEQVRELHEEGKFEEAQELLREAGLGKFIQAHLSDQERDALRATYEAVRASIEAEDYDAFLAAINDSPFEGKVSEEIFEQLVEAHELREEGDYEGAREVLREAFPAFKAPGVFHRFHREHGDGSWNRFKDRDNDR